MTLKEGMKFYILPDHFDMVADYDTCTVVTVKKNPKFVKFPGAFKEWVLEDDNGNDFSDEWYFHDGAYLEEVK